MTREGMSSAEGEFSFGKALFTETSKNFEGSTIVAFEKNGEITRYALRRDASGNLEGSEFTLQEKKVISSSGGEAFWANSGSRTDAATENETFRVGPTYQMHEDSLREMEEALQQLGITI